MPKPFFSAQHFENSKNRPSVYNPPPALWPREWSTVHFKTYPRMPRWRLVQSNQLPGSLRDVLADRRSRRDFSGKPIGMQELSDLLCWAAGIQPEGKNKQLGHRTYASGGARFPLEVYPIVLNGPVPKGIYHYNVQENSLEQLLEKDLVPSLDQYLIDPVQWKRASVVFVITVIFERNQVKYDERGYRYVFMDTGHLGQNFYLVAESLGLKCCAVGGFVDDNMNKLLDIDGNHEAAVHTVLVGK